MDNPNDGGREGPPRDMGRAGSVRNARAVLEERNQRFLSRRHEFEPQVHDQINRLFKDYQPPLHARLRGFGRAQTLSLAESTVLSLVAVNGRRLEDPEAQALTEHFLASVHNLLAWKWAMTGIAAYMTYRGRRTFRFPFFSPQFAARPQYSPLAAAAGARLRGMWHALRFTTYYLALWVLAEPVFQGANFMRQRGAMERDDRLSALLREGKAQGATLLGGSPDASGQIGPVRETWDAAAREEAARQPSSGIAQGQWPRRDDDSIQDSQATWAPMPPPPSAQFPQGPTSNAWDSHDDFDDASPVAPPPNQTGDRSAGSAWDRIRQQAQHQPKQQHRNQQSWERPQSGGSWGNDVDSARSRGSSSSESYSFSEDRGSGKDTAQRDFDRLLEKERGGSDQDRGSWNRK